MRGRIRSVKPEVHLDEALWDLEEKTGLPIFRAFVGLWNYGDREGRFEWRSRALKAVILPYWRGEMELVLDALNDAGFIQKYEVDGRVFGAVRTFAKHQSVNHKEPESSLPAPPTTRADPPREIPGNPGTAQESPELVLGNPGTSGKGTEGNGRERNGSDACPPKLGSVPAQEFTVERQAVVFQREFERTQLTVPSMGGKHVGGFHAAVVRTASLQRKDPEQLFRETLAKWLAKPLDEVASRSPYACFCQAWGELTGTAPKAPRDVRKGFVEPSPPEAFGPPTNLDDLFGPESGVEAERRFGGARKAGK